jgi:thymidylate synthase
MKQYRDILRSVLNEGVRKQPVRVGADGKPVKVEHGTIGLPSMVFEHDMSQGFPLLTTKKVAFKSVCVELEGFIGGITSKKWYQERGCHIWDQWCNPQQVPEAVKNGPRDDLHAYMKSVDDLGPIYGSQWRKFGDSLRCDQLKTIADRLRENPYDRRMVCSAWSPQDIPYMALPPCHLIWNVIVYGDTISLWWGQRSCDLMLGVPFNIASYGLLLMLLAAHANLKPWKLTGILGDCHIYENQLDAAREQVEREPRPLPLLYTPNQDIFDWTHNHVDLVDYDPHPALDFGKVTVT